jgi:hypothetical protein
VSVIPSVGSPRVSRAGFGVALTNLRVRTKVREGQRPSPARGTRALPDPLHASGVITSAAHQKWFSWGRRLNIGEGLVIWCA